MLPADVTKILAYAAQAAHELVPPDALEPVVQAIANNFVTERCSGEVMTVGLNAMRVICARCPLAMNATLLQDLVQYRTYKDKSVMMAARALMQLYRALNPTLLARKDRGKDAALDTDYVPYEYGKMRVVDHVPGAEVVDEVDPDPLEEDGVCPLPVCLSIQTHRLRMVCASLPHSICVVGLLTKGTLVQAGSWLQTVKTTAMASG